MFNIYPQNSSAHNLANGYYPEIYYCLAKNLEKDIQKG